MAYNHIRARQRREELGLSQYDLAVRTLIVGRPEIKMIRPDKISAFENGHRSPNRTNFCRLAAALDIDPRELETL